VLGSSATVLLLGSGFELLALVKRSVRRWPPRTRRIWELRYGSLASVREIASRQGMNPRTVATILFRARARLLEDLSAGGFTVRCA